MICLQKTILEKEREVILVNRFSWKVAGAAGDGILNAGLMFAKTCLRGGLHVFATAEYPSLIRGGHNHLDVRIEDEEIYSHVKSVDLLVALNKDSINKHKNKISYGGGIIYDGDELKFDRKEVRNDIKLYPMPLNKLANQAGGKIMRNVVAMGATVALTDFDLDLFNDIIRFNFKKKGDKIIDSNVLAAKLGYDYIRENFDDDFRFRLKTRKIAGKDKIFLSGNEAISMGAIKAGCKFFAGYPMTPASSILMTMASQERNFNLVVKHTEDEIAAINMAIGASFAGVRAMTATSGGGFSLMVEGFGLAAQTETPLVVVEAQRPGPATGMATHSGQGDLRFVLHASTDEFPRIIIAPGDVEECFYKTIDAFNLAEKYQLPVIILTDKYLGESFASVEEFDCSNINIDRGKLLTEEDLEKIENYKRYSITKDGVSPRSIPGQKKGTYVASSYEHDEEGFEREEEEIRIAMHDKRFRKLEEAKKDIEEPILYGSEDADVTIVSWGSPKGPIKEAMKLLERNGISTNFLQVVFINPFPKGAVTNIINNSKTTVVIENNKTSQLSGIIKENTGLDIDYKVLKYDGRPFSPEDIFVAIKDIMNKTTNGVVTVTTSELYPTIEGD